MLNLTEPFLLAPSAASEQHRVTACKIHQERHNCTTFFNIYKKSDGDSGELIKAENWDAFRFQLSRDEGKFVTFNSYWNCWTQCHKPFFIDSRQPMLLNMKVYGSGIEEQVVSKPIKVQQNPGRGAKVVSSKKANEETNFGYIEQAPRVGEKRSLSQASGHNVTLGVNMTLNPSYPFANDAALSSYLHNIIYDLSVHAQNLHQRDMRQLVLEESHSPSTSPPCVPTNFHPYGPTKSTSPLESTSDAERSASTVSPVSYDSSNTVKKENVSPDHYQCCDWKISFCCKKKHL